MASLQEITRFALLNNCTVIAATSHREAARYLETYKVYDKKKDEEIAKRKAKAGDVLQQASNGGCAVWCHFFCSIFKLLFVSFCFFVGFNCDEIWSR